MFESDENATVALPINVMRLEINVDSHGVPLLLVSPGRCASCGENVVGEGTGCTAMDQVFHVDCFVCMTCSTKLRGKPFYAVEKKAYCEPCYIVSNVSPLKSYLPPQFLSESWSFMFTSHCRNSSFLSFVWTPVICFPEFLPTNSQGSF